MLGRLLRVEVRASSAVSSLYQSFTGFSIPVGHGLCSDILLWHLKITDIASPFYFRKYSFIVDLILVELLLVEITTRQVIKSRFVLFHHPSQSSHFYILFTVSNCTVFLFDSLILQPCLLLLKQRLSHIINIYIAPFEAYSSIIVVYSAWMYSYSRGRFDL